MISSNARRKSSISCLPSSAASPLNSSQAKPRPSPGSAPAPLKHGSGLVLSSVAGPVLRVVWARWARSRLPGPTWKKPWPWTRKHYRARPTPAWPRCTTGYRAGPLALAIPTKPNNCSNRHCTSTLTVSTACTSGGITSTVRRNTAKPALPCKKPCWRRPVQVAKVPTPGGARRSRPCWATSTRTSTEWSCSAPITD